MTRWVRIVVAVLAMSGVLTSALAACTAGATASQHEHMACCRGGHHKCGASKEASNCCKKSERRPQQLVLAKSDPLSASARWVLLTLTSAQPVVIELPAAAASCALSPPDETIASSPPLYIAFSALLI